MLRTRYIMMNLRFAVAMVLSIGYYSNVYQVHVISPDTISFIPSVVEALVGHVIQLPVIMGVHIGK